MGRKRGFFHFELDIIGQKGRIRIGNNQVLELYTTSNSDNYSGFVELDQLPFPEFEAQNNWLNIRKDLLNCLQTGSAPACSGKTARSTLEAALAFFSSSKKKGRRVNLPLGLMQRRLKVISR